MSRRMDRKVVVGVVLLLVAVVYVYFAPAFMISDGTQTILWLNILPGIVLALLGIVLVATGLRSKKGST